MSKKHFLVNCVIAGLFALLTFLFWSFGNRQTAEPPWPKQVSGISFSPLRLGNDPATGEYPSREEIAADLDLLAGKVRTVRTYGVGGTLAEVPQLARERKMGVALGAWLTADEAQAWRNRRRRCRS